MTAPAYEGYEGFRINRRGHVLEIVLDNPRSEKNTLDEGLHHELARLCNELRSESQARAVLLTGEGSVFSAGGDFSHFSRLRGDIGQVDALRREAKQMIWDLLDVEVPIVCAINGPAVGLAATIALLCDTIFMADGASLGDPHVRIGVSAGDGGAAIWPLLIGPARAKEYLMSGRLLSADHAEQIGLVNHTVPADQLQDRALEFANELASLAPLAVRYTKLAVNEWIKSALNTVFDTSLALELMTIVSEDQEEALNAFRERREGHFRGT